MGSIVSCFVLVGRLLFLWGCGIGDCGMCVFILYGCVGWVCYNWSGDWLCGFVGGGCDFWVGFDWWCDYWNDDGKGYFFYV